MQHQRRLAGPVGPEQRHPLTARHVQVHPVQGDVPVRIRVPNTTNVQGDSGLHDTDHVSTRAVAAMEAANTGTVAATSH